VQTTIAHRRRRRLAQGIGLVALMALCGCAGKPPVALSPIIPPGPRLMTACYLHHDLTLVGDTIDGRTGGIDVQYTATGGPGFSVGSSCLDSMRESLVGDFVSPLSSIPTGDELGCHLPLEDVYIAPGRDHATNLAAATIECQVIGTDNGHPRWWGGVVSSTISDSAPAIPAQTQSPTAGKVVCRILFTETPGSYNPSDGPSRELVVGTSQRVCQSLTLLEKPDSVTVGTAVTKVPSSFQHVCDRQDGQVYAPSPSDDDNLQICSFLAP
jgi:hypothetical protein